MSAPVPDIHGLTFRAVTRNDDDFIFRTIKATMSEYVAATYGSWDDEEQKKIIAENTDYDIMRAIVWSGLDIGVLTLADKGDHHYLSQLYLLPQHQRGGLGSTILKALKQQAASRGLPLRLSVLMSNPAQILYEREGFMEIDRTDQKRLMEFRAHPLSTEPGSLS